MKSLIVLFFGFLFLLLPAFAAAQTFSERVQGQILLQVEEHGEAWYIDPESGNRYYMKDGDVAFQMLRAFGLGITTADLNMIPSVASTSEMQESTSACASNELAKRLAGKILLQVEANGEAWYVYPDKCRRIYLKNGQAAYEVMRFLGLGITNANLLNISADELFVPIEGDDLYFNLKIPYDWTADAGAGQGAFLPPEDPNATETIATEETERTHFLVVEGYEFKPVGFTIDDLAAEVSTALQQGADEIEVFSQNKISLNGYSAYKVHYRDLEFGEQIIFYSILTGNRVFEVFYVAADDVFDKYLPTVERILGTFEDWLFPPA